MTAHPPALVPRVRPLLRWPAPRALPLLAAPIGAVLLLAACESEPPAPPPVEPGNVVVHEDVMALYQRLLGEIRAAPRDGAARGRLGMAYDVNGMKEEALASYAQAIELDGANAHWYYQSAMVLTELGRDAEALAMLDSTLARDPEYPPPLWRKGQILFSMGDFDGAEAAFREAKRRQPKHPAGALGLARVDLQRGNYEAAARILEETLGGGTRAAFVPYLHYLLGTAYRQLGRMDDARRELALGKRGRPLWKDTWRSEIDEYNVSLLGRLAATELLMQTGRNNEAIGVLEELRRENPTDRNLLDQLSRAYFAAGRVLEARSTLEASVAVRPDDDRAYRNLSQIHLSLGSFRDAVRYAELSVELNPNIADGHANYAAILTKVGRPDDALAEYRAALECDPAFPAALLGGGALAASMGLWDEAYARFDRALEDDPENVTALLGRAEAAERLGRMEQAVNDRAAARKAQAAPR